MFRQYFLLCRKLLKSVCRHKIYYALEILACLVVACLVCFGMQTISDILDKILPDTDKRPTFHEERFKNEIARQDFTENVVLFSAAPENRDDAHKVLLEMNQIRKAFRPNETLELNEYDIALCGVEALNGSNSALSFAIRFDKVDLKKKELKYLFKSEYLSYQFTTFRMAYLSSPPDGEQRKHAGIEYWIDEAFRRAAKARPVPKTAIIQLPFITPEMSKNSIALTTYLIPAILSITIVNVAVMYTEECKVLKEYLQVLGLSTPAFIMSHFTFAFIKLLFVSIITCTAISLCTKNMFKLISINFAIFFFALQSVALAIFSLFLGSICPQGRNTIKVAVLVLLGMIFHIFYIDPNLGVTESYIHCLNIFNAYRNLYFTAQIREDYMTAPISFDNAFYMHGSFFTPGDCIIALIINIFLYAAIVFFIEWYNAKNISIISKIRSFYSKKGEDEQEVLELEHAFQYFPNETDIDIDVREVGKVFENGDRAVDSISFTACRGQITALLGPNGAGKTTTFKMLAGLLKPTSGTIEINRSTIGYCPQKNPIISGLSVMEHLWMVHTIKGAQGKYKEEAEQLLERLNILDKANVEAKKLSGGQKRKLCMAMALIGGSRIVLLDEPTAGMDPESRLEIQTILQEEKADRTFLLSTHYLDEAEMLSDRVMIIVHGKIVCLGSVPFVKKRFGSGYNLTVVSNPYYDNEIFKICRIHVEASMGERNGGQRCFVLSQSDVERFPDLFEELEEKQTELGITHMGLSLDSLEQVFFKVLEAAYPYGKSKEEKHAMNGEFVLERSFANRRSATRSFFQVLNSTYKKLLLMSKDYFQVFIQIGIPFLIFVYLLNIPGDRDIEVPIVPSLAGAGIFLANNTDNHPFAYKFTKFVESNGFSVDKNPPTMMTLAHEEIAQMYRRIGGVNIENGSFQLIMNKFEKRTGSVLVNMMSNANRDAKIETSLLVQKTREAPLNIDQRGFVFSIAMLWILLLPSILDERRTKFLHLQKLAGLNSFIYWFSTLIADFLVYCIIIIIHCCVLGFFKRPYPSEGLGVLYEPRSRSSISMTFFMSVVFFFCCAPFLYSVTLFMKSAGKVAIIVVAWMLVIPIALEITLDTVGTAIESFASFPYGSATPEPPTTTDVVILNTINISRMITPYIFPSYAVFKVYEATIGNGTSNFKDDEGNLQPIYYSTIRMVLFGIFMLVALVMMQLIPFKRIRACLKKKKDLPDLVILDGNVAVEIDKVLMNNGQDVLRIEALSKWFKKMDRPALNQVSLGIPENECFGLVGVSGAGKTTCFQILTGQMPPSGGSITINGKSSSKMPVGYCPQFDAILPALTCHEALMILSAFHGYKDYKRIADLALSAVGMENSRHKMIGNCSGGQVRRISLAVALLGDHGLVVLDEPTAGIDSAARRDLWNLITTLRDSTKTSIVLSSHSMDECEALCSRIAILKNGEIITIGTPQEIKSRYGEGYVLTMVAGSLQHRREIVEFVAANLPNSVLKTNLGSSTLTLKWIVPRSSSTTWSKMFSMAQSLATQINAVDYCLEQTSLEDTFLKLAKGNFDEIILTLTTPSDETSENIPNKSRIMPQSVEIRIRGDEEEWSEKGMNAPKRQGKPEGSSGSDTDERSGRSRRKSSRNEDQKSSRRATSKSSKTSRRSSKTSARRKSSSTSKEQSNTTSREKSSMEKSSGTSTESKASAEPTSRTEHSTTSTTDQDL